MSQELQRYELEFSYLGDEGRVVVIVKAYDEAHAIRLGEYSLKHAAWYPHLEQIHLVAE